MMAEDDAPLVEALLAIIDAGPSAPGRGGGRMVG
jgi:hypothetical protein